MKRYKLGDILTVKHGFPFKGEYFSSNGKYIVLTPGNFYEQGGFKYTQGKEKYYLGESPAEYICSKGDLIVAMTEQTRGLLGSTAIVPEDDLYLHNQRIGLIKFDTSVVDKNYLNYLFRVSWVRSQLESSASGTKIKHTSPERICDVKIHLPPLSEQRKIGSLLSFIDNKIALNNRVNATLEAMAKTLYDYWFVQFDFPDEKGRPYKTSGGKMVYNEELGREIPAGWEVVPLQAIAHIVQGNSPEGDTLNETGDGMVFYQGKADFGFRFPDVRTYTTSPYRIAEKYDTLLSVRAPVGSVNMAREKCCIGRGLAAIRCDFPSFMYYTLMKIQPHLEKYSGIGTTFNAITKDDIMAFNILQPHRIQISHFEKIVSDYDKDILCRTEENHRLAALRDWLLPMLMNGQVGFRKGF